MAACWRSRRSTHPSITARTPRQNSTPRPSPARCCCNGRRGACPIASIAGSSSRRLAALAAAASFALAIGSGHLLSWSRGAALLRVGRGRAFVLWHRRGAHGRPRRARQARAIGGRLAVRVGGGLGHRPACDGAAGRSFSTSQGMFWFSGAARDSSCARACSGGARRAKAPSSKEEYAPQIGTSVAAGEIAYGEEDADHDAGAIAARHQSALARRRAAIPLHALR